MVDRRCRGQGQRGPCRRLPAKGHEFCALHRDSNVVSLGKQGKKPRVRSADTLVAPALAATLSALDRLTDEHTALVRLAERYAAAIDGADDYDKALAEFGPKLRLTLESLGATVKPSAEKDGGSDGKGRLAALRSARTN